jgi:phosphatidylinositol 4-kinase
MFDVSTFLMRWLFLSNLVRDVAEIQTLPFQPHYAPPPPPPTSRHQLEEAWRDQCLRGILAYPPGSQRLMVMDALRIELVQRLSHKLQAIDSILEKQKTHRQRIVEYDKENASQTACAAFDDPEEDPFLDADIEILRAFEKAKLPYDGTTSENPVGDRQKHARLIISGNGTNLIDDSRETELPVDPHNLEHARSSASTISETQEATQSLRQVQNYLPQLVSAVLKSPPAFEPHLANPIQKLRHLMLNRCLQDPSWGIELCWLLEAEVGRAWKTLFEHRQQTGRRLIIVLPADKAAVLAKIGTEKREAFDLLQDAEQATAYGYTMDQHLHKPSQYHEPLGQHQHSPETAPAEGEHTASRLPSSLSLRRCSHFGDTMHFIDRLTTISLDLRMVPTIQRDTYLKERLLETNRRIRRRMVTGGDVSLDVEDNRSPYDWPGIEDLSIDMLKHSVHFPLVPQAGTWPTGKKSPLYKSETSTSSPELVRVLNIVVPESRILASRDRCPYLLHMEVADTGFDGWDARLYASGKNRLGSSIQEVMGMSSASASSAAMSRGKLTFTPKYAIPSELAAVPQRCELEQASRELESESLDQKKTLPRGGWQADSSYYADEGSAYVFPPNPFDEYRQQEYEQLHQQMQISNEVPSAHSQTGMDKPAVSLGLELLNSVFGKPWSEKCREIREASPFGQVQGWRLASFLMKAGEDIRREALVMQIISKLRNWFDEEIPVAHRPYMRPYTIMCVGGDAGLIECLSDAKSIDEVKKQTDSFTTLRDYFERAYGPPTRRKSGYGPPPLPSSSSLASVSSFETAQDNFLRSLVGYSVVCYVLQIKDRHNANILLDREGHIMHIDFGFVLGDTPKMGKVPIFSERAPFKLSQEFWEVLGGWNINQGGLGVRFCKMFELAFECAAAHTDEIASLVEATVLALSSSPRAARMNANGVRNRLRMRGAPGSIEQKTFVMDLVNAALTSWGTSTYDWLQRNMNGYQ